MLEPFFPPLGGLRIVESPHTVTKVDNFPASKNRSKRIRKKLLKRLGQREEPAIYFLDGKLFVHSLLFSTVIRDDQAKNDSSA